MSKNCWWGTKDTDEHISQCITSCHNPKIRAYVSDEVCLNCPYKEEYKEAENE